jgi:hypothetical protein
LVIQAALVFAIGIVAVLVIDGLIELLTSILSGMP